MTNNNEVKFTKQDNACLAELRTIAKYLKEDIKELYDIVEMLEKRQESYQIQLAETKSELKEVRHDADIIKEQQVTFNKEQKERRVFNLFKSNYRFILFLATMVGSIAEVYHLIRTGTFF